MKSNVHFWDVHFWPSTGFPDKPWREDAGEDAFVKTARRVCERYSEGLRGYNVRSSLSSLRLFVWPHSELTRAEVTVQVDPTESFESAGVSLPPGVEGLSPQARAWLVLDVVHGAVLRLGEARGCDRGMIEAARQHVIDEGFTFIWQSPWKSSPNRKLEARAVYRLLDDGYGRVRVEVRDRSSLVGVSLSGEELAFSTLKGFQRSAKTLRWVGSESVSLVPYCGLFGTHAGGLTLEVTTGQTTHEELPPPVVDDAEVGRPAVSIAGKGSTAPEQQHEIRAGGGGPMNLVPHAYSEPLSQLLHLVEAQGTAWWADSELRILTIHYWFREGVRLITVGRTTNQLNVTINRSLVSMLEAEDPSALARADVEAALSAITKRMKLGPPPELPEISATTLAEAAAEDLRHARLNAMADGLIHAVRDRLEKADRDQVDLNLETTLGYPLYSGVLTAIHEAAVEGRLALTPAEDAVLGELLELGGSRVIGVRWP